MMKDFVREDALGARLSDGGVSVRAPFPELDVGVAHAEPCLEDGGYRQRGKRALDIALVLLSLPVSLPIIALSAVALWMESGLPFYAQDRLGRNGKRFRIVKLRTMIRDADAVFEHMLADDPALRREWEETQKLKDDPRITRVGAMLRATSLDELPQLWNVLTGDMTLVGPRPMLPQQLSLYGDPRAYFALRPGLTGYWQVSSRNEDTFERRRTCDAEYFRGAGLREDVRIMWQTIGVVFRRTGY